MPDVTRAACRRIAPRLTAPSTGRAATAGRSSTVLRMVAAGTVIRGAIWLLMANSSARGPASRERTYEAEPVRETGKPRHLGPAFPAFEASDRLYGLLAGRLHPSGACVRQRAAPQVWDGPSSHVPTCGRRS